MQTATKKRATRAELAAELVALRSEVSALREDNARLEVALELAAEHGQAMEEETAREKTDLELRLEMTTEHSDAVEEELRQRAEEALRKSEQQLRMIVDA